MSSHRRLWLIAGTAGALLLAGGWAGRTWNLQAIAVAAIPARPDLSAWPRTFSHELASAEAQTRTLLHPAAGLARLGNLYHANGFFAEASLCYQGMAAIQPRAARWPHLLANILAGFGRIEEALPLQQRAADLGPDNIAVHLRLGDLQIKSNQTTDAFATYERVLILDPDNVYAWLGLARCDLAAHQWNTARERLLKSVARQPDFFGGWSLLATVHEHLGDIPAAENARRQGTMSGRFRDLPDPWLDDLTEACYHPYQLSVAAAITTDEAKTRRWLERAIALAPENSGYRRHLAKVLREANEHGRARQELERAVASAPRDSESWAALVDLIIERGDTSAAMSALANGLHHCPGTAYLHFMNGHRLAAAGRSAEAETAFKASIRIQPNEARAYIQLATLYVKQASLADAIAQARAAQAAEPGNGHVMVLLARLVIMGDDPAEARRAIAKLRENPDAPADEIATVVQQYLEVFGHQP